MTAVSAAGPLLLVRNASVLPGSKVDRPHPTASVACGTGAVRMTVEGTRRDLIDRDMCDVLALAVSQGAVLQGMQPPPVAVHIGFAPARAYVLDRARSLTIGGSPRMRLVLPTLETAAATTANAVKVISHESYHLFAAMARRPGAGNEDVAHLVGACSVLMILGELHEPEPGGIAKGAGLPGPVIASHDAGMRLRERLAPMFAGGNTIRTGSRAARRLVSMCESIPAVLAG